MSTLNAQRVQLGTSATATQNFTITADAADGTMKLARGNAGATTQDILTVDASGNMTPGGNLLAGVIGTGQTWQDFTATRVLGTNYTNSTGKPIMVSITTTEGTSGAGGLIVGGLTIASNNANQTIAGKTTFYAIIPNGVAYSYTVTGGTQTLFSWSELR